MHFRVLGPFEIWDDSVRLELGAGPERTLLALLVLHRNEVVPLERIVNALRADDEPATARELLDGYFSRLRELIGAEILVARPWGYGLRAPPATVDADEFDRLVRRAREEEPARAVETLHEALALWRGPALADMADEPFARSEVSRLEEARRAARQAGAHARSKPHDAGSESVGRGPRRQIVARRLVDLARVRRTGIAAGVAVVAAAAVAVAVGVTRGEARHVVAGPNMVAALDPETNRLVDAFSVGSIPTQLAIGGEGVWVLNADDRTISRVDPNTRSVGAVAAGDATSVAAGGDGVWAANGWTGTVSRLDSRSGEVERTIELPGLRYTAARFIAPTGSDVWVSGVTLPANSPSPFMPPTPPSSQRPLHFPPPRFLVWHIDPRTNRVTRTAPFDEVAYRARTVSFVGDSVVVRSDDGLVQLDRRSGHVQQRLRLPSKGCCETGGVAVDARSLWVIGIGRGVLWRVDRRTWHVVATIPLRGQPNGVAVAGHAVWVADGTGVILKIDPHRNAVVARIPITGVPRALAYGLGRLWVALD